MAKCREAIQEKLEKLRKLEDLHKALKSGKELRGYLKTLSEEKGSPKTVEACKNQISNLKERIQKDELNMKARE